MSSSIPICDFFAYENTVAKSFFENTVSVLFYIFSQKDFSKVSTNIPLRSESGFDNFFCQIYVLFNEWNVFIIRMTVMNRTAFVFIPYNMNWFSKLTQSDWFWAVTSANLTNCPFKPVKHNVNVLLWDEFNSPDKKFYWAKKILHRRY